MTPLSPLRRYVGPYNFLRAPRPLAFAHRGGAAIGDENSIAAFARSAAAGFQYIETDTHASQDGVAVLFHDESLHRMTGDHRTVSQLTWAQLQRISRDGEALIPRLDDVLAAFPEMRFNIDVKTDAAVAPALEAIAATGARDRVLVASFSDTRITRVRQLSGPRLATSMGRREITRLWTASRWGRGLWGFVPRAAAAQVPYRWGSLRVVDERFIAYCHRIGIDVHVWTIDDAATMHLLLDAGVDGIMTDRIDILADVYRSRGHWPPA